MGFTFFFFLEKLLSSSEFHPWSLSVFLQAQRLWHQVLSFMAGQSQNQTMHKTWVSFQGHSDAFIHSYYAQRKTQTYTAASISSSSIPLSLSDFSKEAMNWSVSTAGSCNNIITRREKCGFTICLNWRPPTVQHDIQRGKRNLRIISYDDMICYVWYYMLWYYIIYIYISFDIALYIKCIIY